MPQRPKEEVRRAILAAARSELAEAGYPGATLGSIADAAGMSIGNVYKYFPSKDALFAEAVSPGTAKRLRELLRMRIESLGGARDVDALERGHPYHQAARELWEFTVEHRNQVLFLLRHTEGSPYEGFAERLARELADLAKAYARRAYPPLRLGAAHTRSLLRIYRSFVGTLASVLEQERSLPTLAAAASRHTAYHLAGLQAFFTAVAIDPHGPGARS